MKRTAPVLLPVAVATWAHLRVAAAWVADPPAAGGPPPLEAKGGERGSERPRGGGFGTMPRQTLVITFTNTSSAPSR
jgi:hypothetical protein